MNKYGDNQTQGEFWNDAPGRAWVEQDVEMNARLEAIAQILFGVLGHNPTQHILDVGCGGGDTTMQALQYCSSLGSATGLDISEPLLQLARAKVRGQANLHFINADAQSYALPEKHYQFIISRFGVMFFADPVKAFANLRSALTEDGTLAFVCWGPLADNAFFTDPIGAVEPHVEATFTDPGREPGPLGLSDIGYLKQVLQGAGFNNVTIDPVRTQVVTGYTPEQEADLLMRIGFGMRLMKQAPPPPKVREHIRESLINTVSRRLEAGKITYPALVYLVQAKIG